MEARQENVPEQDGDKNVQMIKLREGFSVWTKCIEARDPAKAGKTAALVLHGGPGFNHEYLEVFGEYLANSCGKMFFYDQLGSHFSDKPDDMSLWNVERFVEEVEQVRCALGLEKFVLVGQSWGGILGLEYAIKYGQNLKALVISNMTAGIADYESYIGSLRAKLPAPIVEQLAAFEEKEAYTDETYEALLNEHLYSKHVCRLNPWPEPVMRAFTRPNMTIYNHMQGPNEFTVIGNLKGWECWDRLHSITVPTLVISGEHDTMNPADIRRMAELIPDGTAAVIDGGSHMAFWDAEKLYFDTLLDYLDRVGAGPGPAPDAVEAAAASPEDEAGEEESSSRRRRDRCCLQ